MGLWRTWRVNITSVWCCGNDTPALGRVSCWALYVSGKGDGIGFWKAMAVPEWLLETPRWGKTRHPSCVLDMISDYCMQPWKKGILFALLLFFLVHFCYQWHLTEFIFQPVAYTYFQASGNVSYLGSNHSQICMHSTILFKTECCLTYDDETKTMQPASSWVLVFSYWRWIQYQKGTGFTFAWVEVFTDMVFLPTTCYSLAEPFTHHPMKYPLNI